jgi:SnoaL-like protein
VNDSFRRAVEAKDPDAMSAALAPDVVFRSPIVFKPYEGREAVMGLLSLVAQVFEDFRYVDELHGEGTTCLLFRARIGDRELDGIDYLKLGPDGLVTELMVMVRPLSGAHALASAMEAKLQAASESSLSA